MSVPKRDSRIADPFDRFEQTIPQLPDSVVEEYPELGSWQEEWDQWFADLRQVIEANQQVLLAKIQELDR